MTARVCRHEIETGNDGITRVTTLDGHGFLSTGSLCRPRLEAGVRMPMCIAREGQECPQTFTQWKRKQTEGIIVVPLAPRG